jgi:hypothetical protein
MLPSQTRFRVNDREVAAEVFDGEAIILNLATGAYYSIDKAGALIWILVVGGHSLEETVATLVARYEVPEDRARADVEQLADALVREELVKVADGHRVVAPPPEPVTHQRLPYTSPALNIYRDMGAMLALDPPMPRLDEIPWKESGEEGTSRRG